MKVIPTYEQYIKGYKDWKKDRPAKHEQTKALRKAKATAKAQDQIDAVSKR